MKRIASPGSSPPGANPPARYITLFNAFQPSRPRPTGCWRRTCQISLWAHRAATFRTLTNVDGRSLSLCHFLAYCNDSFNCHFSVQRPSPQCVTHVCRLWPTCCSSSSVDNGNLRDASINRKAMDLDLASKGLDIVNRTSELQHLSQQLLTLMRSILELPRFGGRFLTVRCFQHCSATAVVGSLKRCTVELRRCFGVREKCWSSR